MTPTEFLALPDREKDASMGVDTLSNSCGLSVAAIHTFLEGKNPQVETVLRIADIFDMELKLVKREENA